MEPQRHFLPVTLSIQRQQPGEHVIARGIGPAVAPGQLAAAGDGAVGLQLALEIEGVACLPEEQLPLPQDGMNRCALGIVSWVGGSVGRSLSR